MKTKLIITAVVTFFVSDAIAITRANRHNQKKNDLLQEVIELMGGTLEEIAETPENAAKILVSHEEAAAELTTRLQEFTK